MTPHDVKKQWPLAWKAAAAALAINPRNPIAAIKAARVAEPIDLLSAKKLLTAIQEAASLEDSRNE